MIIICVGDSFTDGMELWDEQNIPGFAKLEIEKARITIAEHRKKADLENEKYNQIYSLELKKNLSINEEFIDTKFFNKEFVDRMNKLRKEMGIISHSEIHYMQRDLTYVSNLSKILGCKTVNLGVTGGSGHGIVSAAIPTIKLIKEQNPDDQIICLYQHTAAYRIVVNYKDKNISVVLGAIEHDGRIDPVDAYEIKNIYAKYKLNENIIMEYLMAPLTLQKICLENGIDFLHFRMVGFEYSDMFETFYKNTNYIKDTMNGKLLSYHGGIKSAFMLPLLHFNCESQPLIANWLIEEMQKRGMV